MCPKLWSTVSPIRQFANPCDSETTLEKPPSAELSPDQMDSDSLPPYEMLDAILAAYVEDNQPPDVIAKEHGFDLALVRKIAAWWIQRVQTAASRTRTENLAEGIRVWPSLSHSREAGNLKSRQPQTCIPYERKT